MAVVYTRTGEGVVETKIRGTSFRIQKVKSGAEVQRGRPYDRGQLVWKLMAKARNIPHGKVLLEGLLAGKMVVDPDTRVVRLKSNGERKRDAVEQSKPDPLRVPVRRAKLKKLGKLRRKT